jgi:integrase
MRKRRLSAKAVEKQRQPGYYADGEGLYLQVTAPRTKRPSHDTRKVSKSWIFRYQLNGRSREMGLGAVNAISLAEARRKAQAARALLVDRIDPIDARNAQRAAEALDRARTITFADCASRYVEAHRAGWRNAKHQYQWKQTLGDAYCAPIASLPVSDIDTGLVLKVLEPIWTEKPETATRLRARLERVLDWATTRGYRKGANPARWRGHLSTLLPALKKRQRVRHHPALPYEQIGQFIAELRKQGGTAARALEFTILAAARTGEVVNATPDEFDLDKGVWTVPAGRMKGGVEHRVPLPPRAVEIVRAQPEGVYVFPGGKGGRPLSNMAMLALLRRMGREDLTVHGFRSSFRDWAAECTTYPHQVCEKALAHAVSDATEAAYRRGDLFEKRRRLMAEWATHCGRPAKAAKVVALKTAGNMSR